MIAVPSQPMRDADGTELVRDRTGELVPVPDPEPEEHTCVDGWLPADGYGRPRPCPEHKPHLKHYRTRGWTTRTPRRRRPA